MTMHCMKGKPYKCRACLKKFVFQHQRQKHEETHSPDDRKKHHCDKEGCGARYLQGSHSLEKYWNLEGVLEKSLKIKSALNSTVKSLKSLEKSLNSTIFSRTQLC